MLKVAVWQSQSKKGLIFWFLKIHILLTVENVFLCGYSPNEFVFAAFQGKHESCSLAIPIHEIVYMLVFISFPFLYLQKLLVSAVIHLKLFLWYSINSFKTCSLAIPIPKIANIFVSIFLQTSWHFRITKVLISLCLLVCHALYCRKRFYDSFFTQ